MRLKLLLLTLMLMPANVVMASDDDTPPVRMPVPRPIAVPVTVPGPNDIVVTPAEEVKAASPRSIQMNLLATRWYKPGERPPASPVEVPAVGGFSPHTPIEEFGPIAALFIIDTTNLNGAKPAKPS